MLLNSSKGKGKKRKREDKEIVESDLQNQIGDSDISREIIRRISDVLRRIHKDKNITLISFLLSICYIALLGDILTNHVY